MTPILNTTNGKYYEVVIDRFISPEASVSAASTRTFEGLRGHIVTIDSAAENSFVKSLINATDSSTPNGHPWWIWIIGASDTQDEQVWRWLDGPEKGKTLSYKNFPFDEGLNDSEDYVAMAPTTGTWVDITNVSYSGVGGYVVEYSNSAPILTASAPALAGVSVRDPNPTGQSVASFLGNSLFDSNDASFQGIAIHAVSGSSGRWQFRLDGRDTWADVGSVSTADALLLKTTDFVRFVSDGAAVTQASLSYYGWDQSSGVAGSRINAGDRGGFAAFSTSSNTAALTTFYPAVISSTSYTLKADEYDLELAGTSAITGTGNALDNLITGNGGANTLIGLAGNDTLKGGAGNDVLDGGSGIDTADFSDKTLSVTVNLRSPAMTMARVGNVNEDRLRNIENLIGGSGNDSLTGNGFVNVLSGGSGDDTLDGGGGADVLVGGAGNDTFVIDHAGDVVTELAGEGIDLIRTTLTQFDLIDYDHVENLMYTGQSKSILKGNDRDNQITGGRGADILDGGAGDDSGNDLLRGGLGNDRYRIHEVVGGNDTIQDSGGSDGVEAVDYGRSSLMTLSRTGTSAQDLAIIHRDVGSGVVLQTTTIKGQYASSGRLGASAIETAYQMAYDGGNLEYTGFTAKFLGGLIGNSDNNIIVGFAGADRIDGRGGIDAIFAGMGNDTVRGGAGNDVISGDDGNDALFGDEGNDKLRGDAGNDVLTGGTGADQFWFRVGLDESSNLDTITDFQSGIDQIWLAQEIFDQLPIHLDRHVDASNFTATGSAVDQDDYLIYSTSNNTLYYDADGNGSGAAVAFAILTGVSSLSANDFLIM